ncbi:MAG: hypothetical protein AAB489_00025, partial [Patescibacteria group bacterium]
LNRIYQEITGKYFGEWLLSHGKKDAKDTTKPSPTQKESPGSTTAPDRGTGVPGRMSIPGGNSEYENRSKWLSLTQSDPSLQKYWKQNAYGKLAFDEESYFREVRLERYKNASGKFTEETRAMQIRVEKTLAELRSHQTSVPAGEMRDFYTKWIQRIEQETDKCYKGIDSLYKISESRAGGMAIAPDQMELMSTLAVKHGKGSRVDALGTQWEALQAYTLKERMALVQDLNNIVDSYVAASEATAQDADEVWAGLHPISDREWNQAMILGKALERAGAKNKTNLTTYEQEVSQALTVMSREANLLFFNRSVKDAQSRMDSLFQKRIELTKQAMEILPGNERLHRNYDYVLDQERKYRIERASYDGVDSKDAEKVGDIIVEQTKLPETLAYNFQKNTDQVLEDPKATTEEKLDAIRREGSHWWKSDLEPQGTANLLKMRAETVSKDTRAQVQPTLVENVTGLGASKESVAAAIEETRKAGWFWRNHEPMYSSQPEFQALKETHTKLTEFQKQLADGDATLKKARETLPAGTLIELDRRKILMVREDYAGEMPKDPKTIVLRMTESAESMVRTIMEAIGVGTLDRLLKGEKISLAPGEAMELAKGITLEMLDSITCLQIDKEVWGTNAHRFDEGEVGTEVEKNLVTFRENLSIQKNGNEFELTSGDILEATLSIEEEEATLEQGKTAYVWSLKQ